MIRRKKGDKNVDSFLRVTDTGAQADYARGGVLPSEVMINGEMSLGRSGNPVTILIEDEVTGEQLEISGVRNAFLVVEDTRKKTSGWLALAVGSMDKVNSVLSFLSQSTLDAIKKFTGR